MGWISLHRELLCKPIWYQSSPEHKAVLVTLLLMANHTGREWWWKGEKFEAEPGQFVTSIKGIQDRAGKGISGQNVRSALKRFEMLGFLIDEPTRTGRLITIVNWNTYQGNKKVVKKSTPKRSKEFSNDSTEMALANKLKNHILSNNPKARVPKDLSRWAYTFDLMLRRDKRAVDDIRKVIDYSQQDDFWRINILSPTSLRKQFDRLYLKIASHKQAPYQAPYHKVRRS